MTAPTLFDPIQPIELERVSGQIAKIILKFRDGRRLSGRLEFHAQELHDYVADHILNSAPASADRILRELRRSGRIQYTVVNRRQSLYRLF
jgi:hypothetical protein